jgi:hypothetical protein
VKSWRFRTSVRGYSMVCVGDLSNQRQAHARNVRFPAHSRAHTCYIHRCHTHAHTHQRPAVQPKSRTYTHYIPCCPMHKHAHALVCKPLLIRFSIIRTGFFLSLRLFDAEKPICYDGFRWSKDHQETLSSEVSSFPS